MTMARILFIPEQEWRDCEVRELQAYHGDVHLGPVYELDGYDLSPIIGTTLWFVAHPKGWKQ